MKINIISGFYLYLDEFLPKEQKPHNDRSCYLCYPLFWCLRIVFGM